MSTTWLETTNLRNHLQNAAAATQQLFEQLQSNSITEIEYVKKYRDIVRANRVKLEDYLMLTNNTMKNSSTSKSVLMSLPSPEIINGLMRYWSMETSNLMVLDQAIRNGVPLLAHSVSNINANLAEVQKIQQLLENATANGGGIAGSGTGKVSDSDRQVDGFAYTTQWEEANYSEVDVNESYGLYNIYDASAKTSMDLSSGPLLTDFYGYERQLKSISKAIADFIKPRQDTTLVNRLIPLIVLMYGVPGSGKTTLPKSLARAFECSCLITNPTSFNSAVINASERALRRALSRARVVSKKTNNTTFIVFDEVDGLGNRNSNITHITSRINVFLQELVPSGGDQTIDNSRIVVFLLTNKFSGVDGGITSRAQVKENMNYINNPLQRISILRKTFAPLLKRPDAISENTWTKLGKYNIELVPRDILSQRRNLLNIGDRTSERSSSEDLDARLHDIVDDMKSFAKELMRTKTVTTKGENDSVDIDENTFINFIHNIVRTRIRPLCLQYDPSDEDMRELLAFNLPEPTEESVTALEEMRQQYNDVLNYVKTGILK